MGWIDIKDKYPPEGLEVLLEVSGWIANDKRCALLADHSFYLGSWIVPSGKDEGEWVIEVNGRMPVPTVHAWMPLPKHYQPQEHFTQEPDLMEHAMFEDDPPELYKGNMVYEQMDLEEFLGGGQT